MPAPGHQILIGMQKFYGMVGAAPIQSINKIQAGTASQKTQISSMFFVIAHLIPLQNNITGKKLLTG
jgi:hypothetical protein